MFINIHIYSKNYNSIKKVSEFFNKKILLLNLTVLNDFKPIKKRTATKTVTTLKSPHVNKTAQEHFVSKYYTKQFKLYSYQSFLFLVILKHLKKRLFFDVGFKIKLTTTYKSDQKIKNQLNPDNFVTKNKQSVIKTYLKLINNYGDFILTQHNSLDSSVG